MPLRRLAARSGGASGSGTGLSVYQCFLNVNVESLSDYVKDPVENMRKLKDNGHELTRKQQLLYHLSLRQKRLIRHVEERPSSPFPFPSI